MEFSISNNINKKNTQNTKKFSYNNLKIIIPNEDNIYENKNMNIPKLRRQTADYNLQNEINELFMNHTHNIEYKNNYYNTINNDKFNKDPLD